LDTVRDDTQHQTLVETALAWLPGREGRPGWKRVIRKLRATVRDDTHRQALTEIERGRERLDLAHPDFETPGELARKAASQVLLTGQPVGLPPMWSHDRLLAHSAIEDCPGVRTSSVGAGSERLVMVLPVVDD
ncbi:MAG: hypothetical protein GY842_05915, partial [bacterium]|nr:hypothetical protein [bacterium]